VRKKLGTELAVSIEEGGRRIFRHKVGEEIKKRQKENEESKKSDFPFVLNRLSRQCNAR
jgi:hypothetical protein